MTAGLFAGASGRLEQPVGRAVADFLCGFAERELPEPVLHQARRVVLDTVGCMVGGQSAAPAQALLRTVAALAGPGGGAASVLGTGISVSAPDAAFANAYLADVLDFSDTLLSHPSAVVVPAALAVGQLTRATGSQVLHAVVAGYEVGVRAGRALLPSAQLGREVASEFYWKSLAAAASAGYLLGLDAEAWINALGYAAGATPAARRGGFESRPLSWLKTNFAGQAQVGVLAALLAEQGFRTERAMLDGNRHLGALLGSDRWQPTEVTAGLGSRWLILDTTFKHYPCCLYLHPLAQAVSDALATAGGSASMVDSVRVEVPALLATEFADPAPASVVDAEFSAPYIAAVAALGYRPGPEWLGERLLGDPAVLELASRVELVPAADLTERFGRRAGVRWRAELRLADGQVLYAAPESFHGSTTDPLTDSELSAKFSALLANVGIEQAASDAAANLLWNLQSAPDITAVLAQLPSSPAPAATTRNRDET